jgi:hypothetical protein
MKLKKPWCSLVSLSNLFMQKYDPYFFDYMTKQHIF